MPSVIQFKCPNCGADMAFDSNSGMLRCASCGRTENIEKMAGGKASPDGEVTYDMDEEDELSARAAFDHDYKDASNEDEPTSHNTFHGDEAVQYHCNNCGAVIITDT
ncbi:MAG TPA: hypothetical protein DIW41_01160, partial [Lachnospiraceae bacterium]|nr:hypothetical protein [Lachnospiraceae bacterium]